MKFSLVILFLTPTLAAAESRPKVQPRAHEAPQVRVLEPGAAPLAPLRYALKGPQELTVVARGEMTVTRSEQTKTVVFPVVTTPVRLTPQKGGVAFVWLRGSFEPPSDTVTGHLLTALEGSTGLLATEGSRGVISNIFLRARPEDTGTEGKLENRSIYATEMGKGILSGLEVPFPEEPMGVGGRWQVERVVVRGMVSIRQLTTFTFLKREGNRLELSYRFGGKFDEGSGFREHELKLAVSGGGKCTLNLALPMPVGLTDEIRVDATMTQPDGLPTFQSTRVGTLIESKPKADPSPR